MLQLNLQRVPLSFIIRGGYSKVCLLHKMIIYARRNEMPIFKSKKAIKKLGNQDAVAYQVKAVAGQTYVLPLNQESVLTLDSLMRYQSSKVIKEKELTNAYRRKDKKAIAQKNTSFRKKEKRQVKVLTVEGKKNAYVSIYETETVVLDGKIIVKE